MPQVSHETEIEIAIEICRRKTAHGQVRRARESEVMEKYFAVCEGLILHTVEKLA